MNSVSSLKKGVKVKDYGIKQFKGSTLASDRNKWMEENPEIVIFNTHVFIDDGVVWHIIEYIKNG